ncbi:leucine-rich_repeat domain-containing protein [Hexamita inflata]|uniref:Leucine-rich_repeat domain-containing protein n=1 Tax=Hexamita inflata TaxID=28002 RepID=A0ABP1KHF4_9EUKA
MYYLSLDIENNSIQDLKVVEQLYIAEIVLSKCMNVRFTTNPSNLLYLSLQDCNISDISGLQYFTQLKKLQIANSPLRSLSHISELVDLLSLQITGSKLTNVVGISNLKLLQYLDLSENSIISIQPLSQLLQSKQFKQLYFDDNFIVDQEWLVPNYSDWICRQRVPADSDYQNYIIDVNLNINVAQLKSSFIPLITKSNQLIQDYVVKYEEEMKAKYESKFLKMNPYGFGPYLYIDNDPQVRSLNFVAELGVTDLCMNSCPNARKIPRTLKQLQHYNSDLKTLKFAEGAVNLEVLYAHNGNMIVNANGLRALRNLKFLELRYNKIVDQSPVEYLTAKGCLETCFIGEQTQPSQQEIDEARLW